MILASLALAAIEPPQARLDRLHGQIVAAIPELCAHVSTGTTSERGADWLAYSLIVRAGFDGKRAVQVFDKFKLAAFNRGRQFND